MRMELETIVLKVKIMIKYKQYNSQIKMHPKDYHPYLPLSNILGTYCHHADVKVKIKIKTIMGQNNL